MFELLFKYSRDDYGRSDLVFTGDWPLWLIVGLTVIAAAAIGYFLARRGHGVTLPQLLFVGLLQYTAILIVLAMLLQPALKTDRLAPGENTLALLLDTSESMRYGRDASRLDLARQYLADVEASIADLTLAMRRYEVADTARRVATFADSAPVRSSTSLADALNAVLAEARSTPLAAIVLSSDGIDSAGGLSTEQLADIAAFGVPIYTLTAGRERMPEDLELTQVLLTSRALPGSTLPARVSVRHDAPGITRIKIYDGDELLVSTPVELQPDATTTSVAVDIERLNAGHRQLRFSIDALPDEPELRNNRRTSLVNVEDQDRRILYFEGEPRWEYKFLRRAIAPDENINVVTLLSVSPNKFYRQGLDSPRQLEHGFPTSREELFAYDALIIGSVAAATLSAEQLAIVRDFVSVRGGTLLLLAGPNGLGNGGWGQSSIADLLPANLPAASTNSFVRKKVSAVLTPHGAATHMLKLAETAVDNRNRWDELPDIADYQLTGDLKPAAVTLINAMADDGPVPLLITQPFGRGHTYILATGGTWRWQMSLPAEDDRHETFWRQFLRALVATAPPKLTLLAEPRGATIDLRAEFRDAAHEPVPGLDVTAAASHEAGGTVAVSLAASPGEPGVYRARIDAPATGTWYVEAIAARGEELFGIARASVFADPGQAEYINIRADAGQMRRLAEATGGRHLEPDDIAALPDLIRYSSAGITEAVFRPVWDAPAVLLLLLVLKSGEWLLRRRWRSI